MSLADTTLAVNAAIVARVYDQRRGYFLLMRLSDCGHFHADRILTRAEALTYYCARDEVLRHVYPDQARGRKPWRHIGSRPDYEQRRLPCRQP